MDDPRVRELAELLVDRCLDVQPGWQVSVRATPLARPLVSEVARAIARRAAYYLPRINWGPERFRADLDWALEAPLELLGELPPIEAHQVATEDARLTIRAPEDVHAGAVLNPDACLNDHIRHCCGSSGGHRFELCAAPGRTFE